MILSRPRLTWALLYSAVAAGLGLGVWVMAQLGGKASAQTVDALTVRVTAVEVARAADHAVLERIDRTVSRIAERLGVLP